MKWTTKNSTSSEQFQIITEAGNTGTPNMHIYIISLMVTKHDQLLYNLSFSYLSFSLLLWCYCSIFLLCYDMLACFSAIIFFLLFTIYDFHLIFRCIWQPQCDGSIITKYCRRFQSKTTFRYVMLYKLRVLTFT